MAALIAVLAIVAPHPAIAHHPMGGEVPRTGLEGLMPGLAHPIIGPDHLAFIVAVGLLATLYQKGFLLPLVTVGAVMIGSSIHLAQFAIAGAEL
ncbi:MAG TPA: HupE/UreJ family protein [Stenomitos sp.]